MKRTIKITLLFGGILILALSAFLVLSQESEASFNVRPSYVGNTEVQFSWDKSNSDDFDRYEIYRDDENIDTIYDVNETMYHDTGLSQDYIYDYRVEVYVWNHNHTLTVLADSDETGEQTTGEVHGTVIMDTSWTSGESPYTLSGPVTVEKGIDLTIGKDVVINASGTRVEGAYPDIDGITVFGGISFRDLTSLSVKNSHFYYAEDEARNRYPGLSVFNCSDVLIENNDFQDYNPGAWPHGSPGIRFDETDRSPPCKDVVITLNEFTNNYYCIFGWYLEDASIYQNVFLDTYTGIVIERNLNNSEIYENTFEAVDWDQDYTHGIAVKAHNSQIYENDFTHIGEGASISGENSIFHNNTLTDIFTAVRLQGSNQQIIYNSMNGSGDYGLGVELQGNKFTIAHNIFTGFTESALLTGGSVTNTTIEKNRITEGKNGLITHYGFHHNNTIKENEFINNSGFAAQVEDFSNCTFENNQIIDTPGGIHLYSRCYDNMVRDNSITINNSASYNGGGITIGATWWIYEGNERNTIQYNIVTGKRYGVDIYGKYDVNDGVIKADNNTVSWNNLSGNRYGIYIQGGNNNTVRKNTVLDCQLDGISISYTDQWDVKYGGHNNNISENVISRQGAGGHDVMDNCNGTSSNEFKENTMGKKYPTTFSVEGYNETISVRSDETPPPMPQPPEYPAKSVNISNFIVVSYWGFQFDLSFHYTTEQLRNLKEENLEIWRWQWSAKGDPWVEDQNSTVWRGGWSGSDSDSNEVYSNIKNSSGEALYALLIPMPVHNIDTERDYETIQAAIDDFETLDGHTITVDPAYTEDSSYENIDVTKQLTIMSTSGGPEKNVLEADDPDKDVLWISADEVTIKGFTIKGSTTKRGVCVSVDFNDLVIENCVFTDNFNGIFYTGYESRADHGNIEIRDCVFDNNKNAGVLLNLTLEGKVLDCVFKGGDYGLALQNSKDIIVVGCVFEEQKEAGIYVLGGSGNSFTGVDFKKGEIGILVHSSEENEFAYTDMEDPKIGIKLVQAEDNKFEDTSIKGATEYCIWLEDSSGNELLRGSVEGTMNGFFLDGSDDNEITSYLVKLAGGNDLVGVDLKNSKDNTVSWVNITDLNTIGYQALGFRLYAGSTHNQLTDTEIRALGSSNSTGLVAGSPLNEFNRVTINNITSYGRLRSTGILLLPFANANEFVDCVVFDVTANYDSFGIYLSENNHNNFTRCVIEKVTTVDEEHWGHGIHGDLDSEFEMDDCEFLNNGIGLYAVNGSAPVANWCDFTGSQHYGILSMVDSETLDAENNWWGQESGPSGVGPGTGDKVSEYVDYSPWIGEEPTDVHQETVDPGTGDVDARSLADTVVAYDTTDEVTITTMPYSSNPGSGFTADLGKYIDVNLDDPAGVTSLEIKLFYTAAELGEKNESRLKMTWWDGTQWAVCSDSGVNTADTGEYAGYIWAKIRSDTTPSLDDMGGTPFGAAEAGEDVEYDVEVTIADVTGTVAPGESVVITGSVTVDPAAPIQKVKVFLDDVMLGEATLTGNDYSYTAVLPEDLEKGEHEIKVIAYMESGDTGGTSKDVNYAPEKKDDDSPMPGLAALILVFVLVMALMSFTGILPKSRETGQEESNLKQVGEEPPTQ